jgi:hypothetical protein
MGIDEIIKAVISAVIAIVVPSVLKQFLPKITTDKTLPWFKWCVAGFVGGALGGIASGTMGLVGGGIGNWAAFGVAIGLLQWFVLRSYRPVEMWFVFASLVGWMLFILGGEWGWIVSGVAVGLLQYLGLTKWQGAGWWILGNTLAWPIAGKVGIAVGLLLIGLNPILAWIIGWGVVGLVGAFILIVPLSRLKEK